MHDIATVLVLLLACAAVGLPLCLVLPEDRFAARFVIAPPIGFGLFAVGGTVFYMWGVAPWISMLAMATAGLAIGAVYVSCTGLPRQLAAPSKPTMAFCAGTVAVILICLLPAWTGGSQFRVFQANVYDQVDYQGAAVVFRNLDYASMAEQAKRDVPDSVVARGNWFFNNRGAVSIVQAAAAVIGRQGIAESTYPFMVAMQVNLLFAALFVFINVFSAGHRLSFLLASALTIGFFQQYVFDIAAWSELSAQPLYLLVVAFTVLAFDDRRFGDGFIPGILRLGAVLGALLAAVLYLYPEEMCIYGVAAATALLLAVGQRGLRGRALFGVAGLGLGACVAVLLGLLFWNGTLLFVVRQLTNRAANPPDWWKYFSAYLFGGEANYLGILANPASDYRHIVAAVFSLPVESMIAGLGLHFLLPTASWPVVPAFIWKLALYGFLAVLIKAASGGVARIWRTIPAGNAARMAAACAAGCVVPFVIFLTGNYWAAGKGLSMAAPLLFLLVTTPLVANPDVVKAGLAGRLAIYAFAFAHLALGLLRPLLVTQFAGAGVPGLPTAAALVNNQKAGLDWNYQRWAAELKGCNGVYIAVENPFMMQLLRRAAAELRVPWASAALVWPGDNDPYLPEGWQNFGCFVSESSMPTRPYRKLIWVAKDRSTFEYLGGQLGVLEIGTKLAPGVSSDGAYGLESYMGDTLRWTSEVAHFEAPNNPAAPSMILRLELWPMPLSGNALKVTVNGETVYNGAIPADTLAVSLGGFVAQDKLSIEMQTNAITHFPNDPRALGVAVRTLRLGKSVESR